MRQYIGARYVPKFMGTYDATQIYEALSVVDNGLGTSYISKIPTPAGTPLTDTDYWTLYGASSGAIISLQEQIDDMNDGSVAGSLQNQINEMNDGTVPGSLQNQIDNIVISDNNRNFLFIADSYGMRSSSQPTWTEILTAALPDNSRQKSYTSIGFLTDTPTPGNFLSVLTEFKNELTDDERLEVTDIVVCGGWNDAREITSGATAAQLQSAIFDFVDYAKLHFPRSKVWCGFIGWQSHDSVQLSDVSTNSLINTQKTYNESVYDNLYHLANASHVMKCTKLLDNTYFHPNPTGSAYLASLIYNNIVGSCDFQYAYTIGSSDITINTGGGSSGTYYAGKAEIFNGVARLFLQFSAFTANASKQFEFSVDANCLPTGHLASNFVLAYDYQNGKAYTAYIRDTGTVTVFCDVANASGVLMIDTQFITEYN